jgi:hypothetical protein
VCFSRLAPEQTTAACECCCCCLSLLLKGWVGAQQQHQAKEGCAL